MRNVILVGAIFSLIPSFVYGMGEETENKYPVIQAMKSDGENIIDTIKANMGKSKEEDFTPCDCFLGVCCCQCLKDIIESAVEGNEPDCALACMTSCLPAFPLFLWGGADWDNLNPMCFILLGPVSNVVRLWLTALYNKKKKKHE